MRRTLTCLLGAAALAAGTLAVTNSRAGPRPPRRPAAPIPLAEVAARGIEGRLGVRLGTVVTVAGEVVENDSKAKVHSAEPFFLRVDEVDGERLVEPRLFSSSEMPLARERPALKVGDRFRCAGYETGGYAGSPDGEFDYVLPYATEGFHFVTRIVVLSPDGAKRAGRGERGGSRPR